MKNFTINSLLVFLVFFQACSLVKQKPEGNLNFSKAISTEISPEEKKEILDTASNSWLYGEGLGNTVIKAGTAIAFPPYALLLVSNAALSLSGYETIGVDKILPKKYNKKVDTVYSEFASVPGRIASGISRKKYNSQKEANTKITSLLAKHIESPKDLRELGSY